MPELVCFEREIGRHLGKDDEEYQTVYVISQLTNSIRYNILEQLTKAEMSDLCADKDWTVVIQLPPRQ